MKSESLVFLAGKRTPFGANGGTLRDINPTELSVSASQAALEQAKVDPKEVDHVIFGNVLHSAPDSIYTPRHVGLKLGVPVSVPALGINRLCGSGFQVIVEAYHQMLAGDTRIALVGGVENMSMSPYVLRGARWGMKMGHTPLSDMMVDSLYDTYAELPMALTAENLADLHGISRADSDAFAIRSQKFYQEAATQGRFKEEIAPIQVKDKKGNALMLDRDEHPKPETTLERLDQLKPVFKKNGMVTAGNASGIVDGAAALVVATESEAKRRGAQPLGRLVAYGIAGCDPKIMGIGPVPAAQIALKRAGMNISQMDLVEVNEAFAPQTLAVAKELEIPQDILNVNGGAIAVGHPLAASGARIIQTLLYELRRRKKRFGLGSACIGGGQGIALIVEAVLN
jgi:acetyl-CoA acetyltransferase family protein